MANALQSFRISKQQPSLKGFTVQSDEVSTDDLDNPSEPAVISAYEYLASKNPIFNDLVASMDLVEVGKSQVVEVSAPVDEKPAKPAPVSPATRERLQAVANNSLSEGISYTYEEAVSRIMESTDVDVSRAQNGFALLLSESIISQTPAGTYYLAGTVPF